MHKRLSTNAAIASIDQQESIRFKKVIGKKKRSNSRVSIPVLSILILLTGIVLLRSSWFNKSNIDIGSLSDEDKITDFMEWFRAAGGNVSDKIAIETFPEMGRGIVALQAVEENDELLFVPKSIIICYDTIVQEWSFQPKLRKKLIKLQHDQEELLTDFLLLEQAKGSASRWAPYLQLLPSQSSRSSVASPLLFASDEDVDALQDERMIKATRDERQRAKKAHSRFKRLFRSFVSDDFLELSRYVWARFLINSRAFSIRGERVLVPFGDVFNGKPDDESRQFDNGQRFLQFHDLQPEGMTIQADRSTPNGGQIFEDYGDNSNYVYFLHHGFLMSDRGFDCTAFRLPALAEAYAQSEKTTEQAATLASKYQVLSRIRVDDAPLACIYRSGKLEDPSMVRIYSTLYTMDNDQAALCSSAKAFSECFPPELMSEFGVDSRQEISWLLSSIRQQQESYPTTLEEDLTIFDELKDMGKSNDRHAVAFRLSRKQILRDAQKVLESQLQNLDEDIKPDDRSVNEFESADVDSGSNKLERFRQWIARNNFPLNLLELQYVSETVGYGTFATKAIASGDVYLKVPVRVVMNVRSAVKSRWVSATMSELQKQRTNVPREEVLLLLHLLEEKFGPNSLQSRWKPYLDMLPALDGKDTTLGSPLFYDEDGEQLKLLEGTDLLPLIINYRKRVGQTYSALFNHFKRSGHDTTSAWLTERRFSWANAMLDSRSIWWNSQRHLVPLLDMVNCQELTSKHKPHHTNLDSSGLHAVTKSSSDFEVGQEIVENYAQPNYIYLLYHGFVLEFNSHDCAHFHLEVPVAARQRDFSALLRTLDIYSWTPDICVFPNDNTSVVRFSKIALLVLDPSEALQQLESTAQSSPQAIASALNLVEKRLNRLQDSNTKTTTDFRTKSALKYRQQQLQHFTALRSNLQAR